MTAKVKVRKNSWLNFSSLLESDGIAFWETAEFPDIVPQENDTFYTTDDLTAGNLDLIAYRAYGDPDLWWVIAIANNIELIPTDIPPNKKLRIPNQSYVNSLFAKVIK